MCPDSVRLLTRQSGSGWFPNFCGQMKAVDGILVYMCAAVYFQQVTAL